MRVFVCALLLTLGPLGDDGARSGSSGLAASSLFWVALDPSVYIAMFSQLTALAQPSLAVTGYLMLLQYLGATLVVGCYRHSWVLP